MCLTLLFSANYVTRISSEGLPCPYNIRQKGDLIVHYQIAFPPRIDKDSREKLCQIFDEIDKVSIPNEESFICQNQKVSNLSLNRKE